MKNFHILIFLLSIFVSCNNETKDVSQKETQTEVTQIGTKLHWHWEDDFTSAERTKIKKYITAVSLATFKILGNYPFDVHYYFKRSDNKSEPIPWAHTERSKKIQAVHFHINPDFDYDVLYSDWTAPHEISHLSIPFLGNENSWFAEGYASYMQYQIMQELGIYTKDQVDKKYQEKIRNIQNDYSEDLVFTENSKSLRKRYNFPAMYWGGAKYFMHIDSLLRLQEGTNLNDLIMKYQICCRNKDKNIEMLLQSLDKDLKVPIFNNLYRECTTKPFREIYKEESENGR